MMQLGVNQGARFEVVRECPHTRARAGLLHTPHGAIETPVFMPVGTQGSVKGLTQEMLERDLGAQIILANTYHLLIRPGHELIARLGGVHRFLSWPRAVLTDSGGFQVFSLSALRRITDDGVVFRSHLDGAEHRLTPESALDIQAALNSDIRMVLDECTEYPTTHEHARQSMERTARWAEQGLAHWRRTRRAEDEAAVFPIVQGSMFADLRRECARRLAGLDADGYALGGLSVGEPRSLSFEMVEATEDLLPRYRPRYCMGVGRLEELGEYVARGVDMMDCVLPTRNARHGRLVTNGGDLVIKHLKYRDDPRPIDEHCPCATCTRYSRAYLRHLFLSGEILFAILATYHNVFTYLDRMRRIRHSIVLGNLPNLLNSFSSQRVNGE